MRVGRVRKCVLTDNQTDSYVAPGDADFHDVGPV